MAQLVFVHGAGCTSAVFGAQLAAFPGSIALNLPGHDRAGSADSIEAFAVAVSADLAARNLHHVVLCGHSMGGAVALELALRGEPRVAALGLLSSGARLRVGPAIFEMLERDFEGATRDIPRYFYAQATPERLEAAGAMMRLVGQGQTLRDFRACDAFDRVDRVAEVRLPLLALTGERDVMTPPKFAFALADRVPGAVARIVADAGHLAIVERPDETNAALRAFVEQITPAIS